MAESDGKITSYFHHDAGAYCHQCLDVFSRDPQEKMQS